MCYLLFYECSRLIGVSGPYYTCLIGVGHEGHPHSIGWTQVPPTVKLAREVMEVWAATHAAEQNYRIDQLTILAWHVPGSRKVRLRLKRRCLLS